AVQRVTMAFPAPARILCDFKGTIGAGADSLLADGGARTYCPSQRSTVTLQNCRRAAPAVAAHPAIASLSAACMLTATAQPTPGVPASGSSAMATHSPRKVFITLHSARVVGGASLKSLHTRSARSWAVFSLS